MHGSKYTHPVSYENYLLHIAQRPDASELLEHAPEHTCRLLFNLLGRGKVEQFGKLHAAISPSGRCRELFEAQKGQKICKLLRHQDANGIRGKLQAWEGISWLQDSLDFSLSQLWRQYLRNNDWKSSTSASPFYAAEVLKVMLERPSCYPYLYPGSLEGMTRMLLTDSHYPNDGLQVLLHAARTCPALAPSIAEGARSGSRILESYCEGHTTGEFPPPRIPHHADIGERIKIAHAISDISPPQPIQIPRRDPSLPPVYRAG